MAKTTIEYVEVNAVIKLTLDEATIIRDIFGALSDNVIKDLLHKKQHNMTTVTGLVNEIYENLDDGLDTFTGKI